MYETKASQTRIDFLIPLSVRLLGVRLVFFMLLYSSVPMIFFPFNPVPDHHFNILSRQVNMLENRQFTKGETPSVNKYIKRYSRS